METEKIVEQTFEDLIKVYRHNIPDFFFTEKELHSYFLNLCFDKNAFKNNGYLLIHAEYPTPFKCSYNNSEIVVLEDGDSKKIRAHIDMVILNSNYVNWIVENKIDNKYLSGIDQRNLFSVFSKELNSKYEEFYSKYKEPILDYAIEFKYLRHGYLGTKYPIKDIVQDIEKLRLLKSYPKKRQNSPFIFVKNTLSAIFIGDRGNYVMKELNKALKEYDSEEYKIVTREKDA